MDGTTIEANANKYTFVWRKATERFEERLKISAREYYFEEIGIDIKTANELLPRRAKLYEYFYPNANMITGSICDEDIFNTIKSAGTKRRSSVSRIR